MYVQTWEKVSYFHCLIKVTSHLREYLRLYYSDPNMVPHFYCPEARGARLSLFELGKKKI